MNQNLGKRMIALLLAVVMVLGFVPYSAFAAENESTGEPTTEESSEQINEIVTDDGTGTGDGTGTSDGTDTGDDTGTSDGTDTGDGIDTGDGTDTGDGIDMGNGTGTEDGAGADEEANAETETEIEEPEELITYEDFLSALIVLEGYADAYALEHPNEDPVALVINYIRCGVEKYTSGTWTTFCGEENTAFTAYVTEQDTANGTTASWLRLLNDFVLPNGDTVEFAHMFGCMDMSYHTGNQQTADLGSWAGDLCDLAQLATNGGITGTVEEMAEEIRTNNDKYFLFEDDDPEQHSFGRTDLYGDLDAFYLLKNVEKGSTMHRERRAGV